MSVTYFNNMFIVPAFGKILCEVQQRYSAIKSPLYSTLRNKKPLKVKAVKGFNLFLVPTKGIEPSHPCEWQILSLLRLPIPPHGQFFRFKSSMFKSSTLKPSNLQELWNSWNLWNLWNFWNLFDRVAILH